MNQNAAIKQADLTRYAKAMKKAGVEQWQVIVEPGRHKIIVGKTETDNPETDWD